MPSDATKGVFVAELTQCQMDRFEVTLTPQGASGKQVTPSTTFVTKSNQVQIQRVLGEHRFDMDTVAVMGFILSLVCFRSARVVVPGVSARLRGAHRSVLDSVRSLRCAK